MSYSKCLRCGCTCLMLFVFIFVCCDAHARTADIPFSAELMIRNEGVGEVRFSPDGRYAYFERYLPYMERLAFDSASDLERTRSRLGLAEVGGGSVDYLAGGQEDRTWYLGSSPEGRYLVFGWYDGQVQRLGVLDHHTGRRLRLNAEASASVWGASIDWISESQFVYRSMSAVAQRRLIHNLFADYELAYDLANQGWKGRGASVSSVGAGRYATEADSPVVSIIRVDASTGDFESVDSGNISPLVGQSYGAGKVAWLRNVGNFHPTDSLGDLPDDLKYINELVVYSVADRREVLSLCEGCSVNEGSPRWSPDGRNLYFSVRYLDGSQFSYFHYIYDTLERSLDEFSPDGLNFSVEFDSEAETLVSPIVWMNDAYLAIRTRDSAGRQSGAGSNYRWFLVRRDGSVVRELTEGVPRGADANAFRAPIGVHDGSLLIMANGELWRLSIDAAAVSLTKSLGPVSPWCAPFAPWRSVSARCELFGESLVPYSGSIVNRTGRVILRLNKTNLAGGDIVILDVRVPKVVAKIAGPSVDSIPLEASSAGDGAVVFLNHGRRGHELRMVRGDGRSTLMLSFNEHLSNVGLPKTVLLKRREVGESVDRNDWLILPFNYESGRRYPLLVYFYPDASFTDELKGFSLWDNFFLNLNIAASNGYVVLLASMKMPPHRDTDSVPMKEIHGQLIRAAENVVAKGYADPDRWAIMGHSYGGYGVNSIITQTNKFKAAISSAGVANVASAYASGAMQVMKATGDADSLKLGAYWAEVGQGRMGSPPWSVPQRYIENSPLFSADKVETPLLLIHGDLDAAVNVNESVQMFAALYRQGKDAQFVRYLGEGHFIRSPPNVVDMWQRIIAFLEENLDGRCGVLRDCSSID